MLSESSLFTVGLAMNGFVLNADSSEDIVYVANLLYRSNANAIIIREGGVPQGIITSKDILRALISIKKTPKSILAKEVMTSPIISVNHQEGITVAKDLMLEKNIRKLPVHKNGDIIGLMVATDFIKDLSWHFK